MGEEYRSGVRAKARAPFVILRILTAMRVLVFETDLFWSARIMQTLRKLGHEAILKEVHAEGPFEADAALVNLGMMDVPLETLVPELRAAGIRVIGHAGHKEAALRARGKAIGCDRIASNSELTFRLDALLAEA